MLLAILAFWFGYKKAKSKQLPAFRWGTIAAAVLVLSQLFIQVIGMTAVELVAIATGTREISFQTTLVSVTAIAGSLLAMYFLYGHLDRLPPGGGNGQSNDEPPPPPRFDQ